jgi:putative Ca2+/H+ antiporter (TMEM165/GDT1 family)
VQSNLLDLRHIPGDEAGRDRRLNVTILNVEWLLWAGIGVALVAVALVGVALYHPQRAVWASGVGLALAGVLLMDLAVWILLAAKSWRKNARGAVPRKDESESDTHSILIFLTYNGDEWTVDTTILGEKESALRLNEATRRRESIG